MKIAIRDILENQVAFGHVQAPPPGLNTLGYVFSQREELRAIKRYVAQVRINSIRVGDWENSPILSNDNIEIDIAPGTFGLASGTAAGAAAGAATGATIGGIAVSTIISATLVALSVVSTIVTLVRMFNAPKAAKMDLGKTSTTYSWDGIKTSFSPGAPVPVIYGEHASGGNLLSMAIDVDPNANNKQLLSLLLGEGCGPITEVNCITLNGVAFSNYNNPLPQGSVCQAAADVYFADRPDVAADPVFGLDAQSAYDHYIQFGQYEGSIWHAELCGVDPLNVSWDWRAGEQNQSPIPGFDLGRNTFADGREISSTSIIYATQGTQVSRVQLQVAALQGLGFFWGGTNPRLGTQTVYYRVEYRIAGGGGYTWMEDRAFTGATRGEAWDAPVYNFASPDCTAAASRYWVDYPDVSSDPFYGASATNAYQHYLDFGKTEGRAWHAELCGHAYEIRLTWLSKALEERGGLKGDASFHHIWLRNITEMTARDSQTYSGTALVAIKAVATNQLQGGAPTVGAVIRGRSVRAYRDGDASTYINTWTRNPAWCLLDYLTNSVYGMGSFINGPNPITQAAANMYWADRPDVAADSSFNFSPTAAYTHYVQFGYYEGTLWHGELWGGTSQINLRSFYDFAVLCDSLVPNGVGGLEPQHCLDLVMDVKKPHWQWTQDILGLYRSSLIYSQGQFKIISDRGDQPVRQIFHAGNIIPGTFQMTIGPSDTTRPNQINLNYPNLKQDYNMDTVFVQDSASVYGRNEPIKDIDLSLIGVTRESEVIREGHWQLSRRRQSLREMKFQTGLEALAVEPGDMCRVGIVTTNFEMGYGGRILEGNAFNVVLDREVTVSSGYLYEFYLWHSLSDTPEVRLVTSSLIPAGMPALTTITVSPLTAFNIPPANGDRWALGITSEDLKLCRVKQVGLDPQSALHTLTVEEYVDLNPVSPSLVSTITFFDLNAPPPQPISVAGRISYNTQPDGTVQALTTIDVVPAALEEGGQMLTVTNTSATLGGSHCPIRYSLNGDVVRLLTGGASGGDVTITTWTGCDHVAYVFPIFDQVNYPVSSGDYYTLFHRGGIYDGFDVYKRVMDIENLALYSEQFNTSSVWTLNGASVVANATTAPDGTVTADALIEGAVNASHYVKQSVTIAAFENVTYSIYGKAGGRSWLFLQVAGDSSGAFSALQAWFNLSSGTIGTGASFGDFASLSAAISSVSNGFYRCSLSGYCGQDTAVSMYSVLADHNGGNIYTGDGASGLYLWGAQFEEDNELSNYLVTGPTPRAVSHSADYDFVEPVLGRHWEESSQIGSHHTSQYRIVPFNSRGVRNYVGDWEFTVEHNGNSITPVVLWTEGLITTSRGLPLGPIVPSINSMVISRGFETYGGTLKMDAAIDLKSTSYGPALGNITMNLLIWDPNVTSNEGIIWGNSDKSIYMSGSQSVHTTFGAVQISTPGNYGYSLHIYDNFDYNSGAPTSRHFVYTDYARMTVEETTR